MMNKEEIKLTEYLHNIIENNMSLRNENDRLWKQKLEYIDRISKAIEYLKEHSFYIKSSYGKQIYDDVFKDIENILGGKE